MTKNPDDTTNETVVYLTSIDAIVLDGVFEVEIKML